MNLKKLPPLYLPASTHLSQAESQLNANQQQLLEAVNNLIHDVNQMKELYWWIVETHPDVIETYIKSKIVTDRLEKP